MTLDEAVAIVKPHSDKIIAEHKAKQKLIDTLTCCAQLVDDFALRYGEGTLTDWGNQVRADIAERLRELYAEAKNA